MEKTKITSHQLFCLTAFNTIGASIIAVTASVTSIAKQDAWITALLSPLLGLLVLRIYSFLGSRHQGMTLIGITKKILGRWVGLFVSGCYVYLFFILSYHLPWYAGDFVGHLMYDTPIPVINFLVEAALVVAALYGIETIARASELFIKFITVLFFLSMILVVPNAKAEYILPILENGVAPVLKSSISLSGVVSLPLILMMMIYPVYIDDSFRVRKALYQGHLWGSLIVFVTIAMTILVLGSSIASKLQYPAFLLAKQINVGTVFSRLEYIIYLVWIVTLFMVTVLSFYAFVTGLAELLGLEDYKKIVIPLGLIAFALSDIAYPDTVNHAAFANFVWPPYVFTFAFLLPVLMVLVFSIKNLVMKRNFNRRSMK